MSVAYLLLILGGLALIVLMMLLSGLLIMLLWNWFVPVIFHNAPTLTVGTGLGLGLLVCLFREGQKPPKDEPWQERLVFAVTRTGLILLIAWVTHLFVH